MYEISDYAESPDVEYPSVPPKHSFSSQQHNAASSYASLNYNGKVYHHGNRFSVCPLVTAHPLLFLFSLSVYVW